MTTPGLEFLYCMITELQQPDNLFAAPPGNYMTQPAVSPSLGRTPSYWNPKSTLSLLRTPLYQFFATAFRLSASKALDQSVRLCDIGVLYFKLLKPWQASCDFFQDCMNAHKLLRHDDDERKDKRMLPVERLDLDLLAQITHNSIPVMGLTKSFASKVHNLSKSKKF